MFLILPVTERFGIQQEVLYVQKGSRQEIGAEIFDVPVTMDVTYDMDYLEIPVLLRYHWLIGRGVDLYSLAGFAFGLKVNDRYQLSGVAGRRRRPGAHPGRQRHVRGGPLRFRLHLRHGAGVPRRRTTGCWWSTAST